MPLVPITATVPPVPHSVSGMAGCFFSIAHVFIFCSSPSSAPCGGITLFCPHRHAGQLRITRHPSFHFSRHTRPAGIFYYMVVTLMFSVGLNVAVTCVTWSPLLNIRCPLNGWALGAGVTLFLVSGSFLCFPSTFYTRRKCPRWVRFVNLTTYYIGQLLLAPVSYCKPAIHISSALCYGSRFSSSPPGAPLRFPPRTAPPLRSGRSLARSASAPPFLPKRVPLIGTLSFI